MGPTTAVHGNITGGLFIAYLMEDLLPFLRQQPIGNFIDDFYCAEALLAIEIDGDGHNEYFDELRDAQMGGVKVMRFRSGPPQLGWDV